MSEDHVSLGINVLDVLVIVLVPEIKLVQVQHDPFLDLLQVRSNDRRVMLRHQGKEQQRAVLLPSFADGDDGVKDVDLADGPVDVFEPWRSHGAGWEV
jgi:hypothetical protein